MALGFKLRLSILLPMACWATLACAQPQASPGSEPPEAFAWEDPSLFPKYCIWRELAPVDGAACWELIVFNHTRETIAVPFVSGQIGFAMRTLGALQERMGRGESPYSFQEVFLIPPNYTERFRVVFPLSTQWSQAEVRFLGSESERQFSVVGPAIAPGSSSPLGMRIEVLSASWQAEAADFELRLSRLEGWILENAWSIERPSALGWQSVPLKAPGLPLVPGAGALDPSIFHVPFGGRRVELYWPLRCLAVRASVPVEGRAGRERSYAIFLPSYPCGEASCEICKFQHEEPRRL
jgi:hypothetical protein